MERDMGYQAGAGLSMAERSLARFHAHDDALAVR
jgi:hypothetical protein